MSPRDEEHDSPRPWSFPSRRRWLWIALDAVVVLAADPGGARR
ncbi:hypothetical protein [Aeromicrobium duanguangcaii]|uniref:RDD family protein n=1 Tax=Aeromicrobium duanguangcaii TaxID=2968086 RepID=A0ABY5KBH5_9ACTN|nr:hypothetical protein [Aeromicrobium duanguangcaii]UUI67819.1 hypothetical protein NP095_11500 [Aeromicrobium duanguangcaii]